MDLKTAFMREIPRVQSKATSSFRIPINIPRQNKLDVIAKFKKQQKQAERLRETICDVDLTATSNVENVSMSNTMKEEKIEEIREKKNDITENCSDLQREQESLRVSSNQIKNEIASLNDAQGDLLWILKKASQFEIQRNHSQRD
jgi:FtsZ-binding cell division protein ZapB